LSGNRQLSAAGGYRELEEKARKVRQDVIRLLLRQGKGYVGGALSAVDILTALYFRILHVDPERPHDPERDRFVLSKGHAAVALYATLAERGFFSLEDLLARSPKGIPSFPDMRAIPGIDMSTGIPGQGLAVAVGMALGAKRRKSGVRVFVLLGDGELQDGAVWEAALAAGHFRLNNLVAIVDRNRLQHGGDTEEVIALEPIVAKWESFRWSVIPVDGHSFEELIPALENVGYAQKPTLILARTVKGKGISFMENESRWHAEVLTREDALRALEELGVNVQEIPLEL